MTFTAAIHKQLEPGGEIGLETPYRSSRGAFNARSTWFRAEGWLALRTHGESGETSAPVTILVHPLWIESAPVVFCGADFIRHEIDWHVQDDGSLCHVLAQQWRWQLGQWWDNARDFDRFTENAAVWCCQNVDSLVTRHLHGHRIGLTKWPKQWRQWSHYQKGVEEFNRSVPIAV